MLLRVCLFTALASVSIAQLTSSCTTCSTNSNYGHRHPRQVSYSSMQTPGFLPNYQGDAFVSDARRQETLRLNQAFFDSLTQTPSPSQSVPIQNSPIIAPILDAPVAPQTEHLTFKNRPIPLIFADPIDDGPDGQTFVEIHGDDTNSTTRTTPTLEFVQFSIQPDGQLHESNNQENHYESEATRAIIEALTRDDPRYIQKDFRVEFVDDSGELTD